MSSIRHADTWWRTEWARRIKAVQSGDGEALTEFLRWWSDPLGDAILARLRRYPPDRAGVLNYLASLERRFTIREMSRCYLLNVPQPIMLAVCGLISDSFEAILADLGPPLRARNLVELADILRALGTREAEKN